VATTTKSRRNLGVKKLKPIEPNTVCWRTRWISSMPNQKKYVSMLNCHGKILYIYMIINQWNPVDINYWWVYCCFLYILYVHCRLYGSILHDPNDVEYWEYAIWSSTNICTWLVIYIW
jgi:hypothetical protein